MPQQPLPQAADLDLSARHAEQIAIARVREGDGLAFEAIFLAHHDEMLRVAEQICGTREVAEEAVQEVFLAIWRSRARWQVTSSLRAYLRRSAQNTALRIRTSRVRGGATAERLDEQDETAGVALRDPTPTPADNAAYQELAEAAERATAAMSPRARDVFLLRRDEELSNREIAQRLGVSVKTVETHMSRALRFMRRRLRRWLNQES